MSITDVDTAEIIDGNASRRRIAEAVQILREKDVRSATMERLRLLWEADAFVRGLPQPLQIGEGLYCLLDHISLPVFPDDLILGRITEEIPDVDGEALLQKAAQEWRSGIPPWMRDGGHECLDWERLLHLGLSGLEDFARQEIVRRIDAGEKGAHLNFLRGAVRIYQSFRNYARRYARAARNAGLDNSAEICAPLAERPPETFAEALQLIWLVGIVIGSPDEIIIFRCLETDMRHIRFGAETGATPDGRLAGKPLSENTSPYPGSCIQGITAMFRSVAKLPLNRINSGALNVRIQPRMVAGEEGLSRLAALLRTYFDMGGLQIQISLADTEELRDAQIHPEAHRNLMVRITGYSAVFIDMCKKAQDEIIRRQEMSGIEN